MNYRCIHCGALTDTTTHAPFCTCGGLFELDFTPPAWDAAKIDKSEWSLFRYRAFMAVDGDSWRDVTLGEGMTPTVQLEPGMYVKVDYMMSTLSFKDRGAAALASERTASTTPTTSPIPFSMKVRKPTSTRFSSSSAAFPTTLSFPSVTARSLSEQ